MYDIVEDVVCHIYQLQVRIKTQRLKSHGAWEFNLFLCKLHLALGKVNYVKNKPICI